MTTTSLLALSYSMLIYHYSSNHTDRLFPKQHVNLTNWNYSFKEIYLAPIIPASDFVCTQIREFSELHRHHEIDLMDSHGNPGVKTNVSILTALL